MKNISLKLQDKIFAETEEILSQIKVSRNMYINQALESYNRTQRREKIRKMLHEDSKKVAESSMEVLKEFEEFLDEGID